MERPTCRTCPYFADSPGHDTIGECLYHPPASVPLVGQNPLTGEPVVRVVPYHPPLREGTFCSNHPSAGEYESRYASGMRPKINPSIRTLTCRGDGK